MITIRDAMTDPALFGNQFGGASFDAWRALLAGFYGLSLNDDELTHWSELTGRTEAPKAAHDELWIAAGRRGGKSQATALLAIYESVFQDYSGKLSPGEVAHVIVVAPDRGQAKSIMRYVSGMLHGNPMMESLIVREDRESIELSNRTTIEIGTASFRTTRGKTAACVIIDEIAFLRSEDSANPDKEIIAALRPALATLGGKLIAISSPYSRRGELWESYRRHYGKNDDPILVVQAASRTLNPSLPQSVIDRAMARDEASAKAEYLGQFRVDVEGYITREVVEGCTVPNRVELPPVRGVRYTCFVDPSGGSSDAFTACVAHLEDETVVVDAIRSRKPPFSPEAVIADYAELAKSYGCSSVTGDRYAGEFPRELFRKHGVQYELSDRPRSDLYRDLLPLMNSGRVELPESDQLLKELVGLERRVSRSGKDSIDHGPGGHDDMANSVAGAVVNAAGKSKSQSCIILRGRFRG
ncbi:hypothetical protein ACUN9V_05700 [Salinicola sp. V024]|uniref:hypothetical protein n=1 Tax=Salinicola sp. V024 TaxID=3459609 RepID=UPI004043E851